MAAMALKEQLRHDLTAAMKARDEVTVRTLRMAMTAVGAAEVAGPSKVELDDDQVLGVLASEAKKRTEAAEAFDGAGRVEQAAAERAEGEVLARYLPAELGDDELDAIVAEEVAAAAGAGQSGPKAMGAVMKAVRARVGSAADGSRVAARVKAALAE
jgi:uncharacterized protein YqeY